MTAEDLTNSTGLNNIKMVWDIWGGSLPVVWHTRLGFLTVIISPSDEADHVMVAVPPRRFMLAGLDELVEIKPGTVVVLDDGRRGRIRVYKAFSTFFFFEDEEREGSSMVGMSQIVRAQEPEERAA
jgi:hypothetical protein